LERNPQIRHERVAEYFEFEKRMREQGFDLTRRYRVAQPLGRVKRAPGRRATASQFRDDYFDHEPLAKT
jgi:hypothetical protein